MMPPHSATGDASMVIPAVDAASGRSTGTPISVERTPS